MSASLSKGATWIHHEDGFVFSHKSSVLNYGWDGSLVTKAVSKPASAKIAGDAGQQFFLSKQTILQSVPGGKRLAFWAAPGPVTDIFLVGGELWVIRPAAPITRLDRFSGRLMGEIGVDFDPSVYAWSLHPDSHKLVGLRTSPAGYEWISLFPDSEGQIEITRRTAPASRSVTAGLPVHVCRGDKAAWFPDGTLRRLEDGSEILDSGAPIDAACSITADIHAISSQLSLKVVDTEGLVLAEAALLKPCAALAFRDRELWAVATTGDVRVLLLADVATGVRPTIFPPTSDHRPAGLQVLRDGRFLMGDEQRPTAHLYSPEWGDYVSGIALPRAGHVHYFEERGLLGFSGQKAPGTPYFAEMSRGPSWKAPQADSFQSVDPVSRTATDRSWVIHYKTPSGFGAAYGARAYHVASPPPPQASDSLTSRLSSSGWHDADKELQAFSSISSVSQYEYEGDTLTWRQDRNVRGPQQPPEWVRVDPSGEGMVTSEGFWLRNPARFVAEFTAAVSDAAWIGTSLFTVRPTAEGNCVIEERREPLYLPLRSHTLAGAPAALRSDGEKLHLVLRSPSGEISPVTLDSDLQSSSTVRSAPELPTNFRVTQADIGAVTVAWNPLVTTATTALRIDYRVAGVATTPWTAAEVVSPTAISARVTALKQGATYDFRLVAISGDDLETSGWTRATARTTKQAIDGTHCQPVARLRQTGGVIVTWQDASSDETAYILRRVNQNTSEAVTFDLPANTASFEDTTAEWNKNYAYTVIPNKGAVSGTPSHPALIEVRSLYSASNQFHLRVVASAWGLVALRWELPKSPFPTPSHVAVERRVAGAAWQRLADLPPSVSHHIDRSVPQGRRIEYRVVTNGANGETIATLSSQFRSPAFQGNGRDGGGVHQDIFYLLVPHQSRVRRFDLKREEWLPDLWTLIPESTEHFQVSDLGLLFSTPEKIYRVPLVGGPYETVNTGGPVLTFWTSGLRLHIQNRNTISSIALEGPEKGIDPVVSDVGPMTSVSADSYGENFYGSFAGYEGTIANFIVKLRETSPGHFERIRSTTPSAGAVDRVRFLSNMGLLLDAQGCGYNADDLSPKGRIYGWEYAVESPAHGEAVLLQGNRLTSYRRDFAPMGSITVPSDVRAFSLSGNRLHLFSYNAASTDGWTAGIADSGPLKLTDPENDNPDPYPTKPAAHFVDASGLHWSIHSRDQVLVARRPDQPRTLHRLSLGGRHVSHDLGHDRHTLAILVRDSGAKRVLIYDLQEPGKPPVTLDADPTAHSLAWVNGNIRIFGQSGSREHAADGSVVAGLENSERPSRTLIVPEASVEIRISAESESIEKVPLTVEIRSGADVFTDFHPFPSLIDIPFLSEAILTASPSQDRLFVWPGGLRKLSDPESEIHVNCVRPTAAVWSGNRLVVLEQPADNFSWLVSYDAGSGIELERRAIPFSGDLHALPDGSVDCLAFHEFEGVRFTRYSRDLQVISHGSGRAPAAHPLKPSLEWLAGHRAKLRMAVEGDGPLTYQWLRNGQAIVGADEPELLFHAPGESDSGTYHLRVSNSSGIIESRTVDLSVRAAVDHGDRTGNFIHFLDSTAVEYDQAGNVVSSFPFPGRSISKANHAMDELGRIHFFGSLNFGSDLRLMSWSPSGQLEFVDTVWPIMPYDGISVIRGNQFRFGDLTYDLAEKCLRRSSSTVLRGWGRNFVTTAGIETPEGQLLDTPAPPASLLPNGWMVHMAEGRLCILHSRDGRSRVFRTDVTFWPSHSAHHMTLLPDGILVANNMKFDFSTFTLSGLPIDLAPFDDVLFIPGPHQHELPAPVDGPLQAYFGSFLHSSQGLTRLPGYPEGLPIPGSTDWFSPHHPDLYQRTLSLWNAAFLPVRAVVWKGQTAFWNIPIREDGALIHAFRWWLTPGTERQHSKIQFTRNLKDWTEELPEGVTFERVGDTEPALLRFEPEKTNGPVFFRLVIPPNPFPGAP